MSDPLDFSDLLVGLEQAPTGWIRDTLAHLSQIQRADLVVNGEQWQLAAAQDQPDRATDVLLLELSRGVCDAA